MPSGGISFFSILLFIVIPDTYLKQFDFQETNPKRQHTFTQLYNYFT